VDLSVLLRPYIEDLSCTQFEQISTYIDILLRWNAKMNLTAIREPEQIVTRHFGESLFLARKLAEEGVLFGGEVKSPKVVDVGSGAGFPGIPLKIAYPVITLSLVETQQRKAVFLKEVLRAINLDAEVKNVRAEEFAKSYPRSADVATLRAVEKFEAILPIVSGMVRPTGKLALLIGRNQTWTARSLLKNWHFAPLLAIPGSENRVILLANQDG
jgi:16S rRNA (guanine527-N7)-methyltransferase